MGPVNRHLPARAWSVSASGAVLLLAITVVIGWWTGIRVLQLGATGVESVRPAAAFLFIVLALGVLLPRAARVAGVLALLMGLITLGHHAVAPDIVPDTAIDPSFGGSGVVLRMALRTAISAVLAAAALLVRNRRVAQLLALSVGYLALLHLTAELYGASFLPRSAVAPMPAGTSLLFLVWSLAFLIAGSESGLMADLLGGDRWGSTTRRMAGVGLFAPLVFGALCLAGADLGWFDRSFALALVTTATAFVFVITTTQLMSRVRDAEAMYRTIVETSQEGICVVTDGRLSFVNDRLASLLGYEPAQLLGTPAIDLILRDDLPAVQERAAARAAGVVAVTSAELRLVRRDGSPVAVISSATPIRMPGSASPSLLVTLTDVSDRVEARQALERAHEVLRERVAALEGEQANAGEQARDLVRHREQIEVLAERLAEANRELEMFSYSVSHDLRTPLRALDGFSRELLTALEPHLDDRSRRYFGRILAAAQRMSTLIDDLLALSRLSRAPLRTGWVDVSAVAARVAAERNAHVEIEPGLRAWADPHLVHVVLDNVIGNALKFSSTQPEPRVEVFAAPGHAIAVRDNGIGFEMQYAEKIFGPFQRLDVSSRFDGTGIGLALAQRVIHRHGGRIRAESEPGRGATFYLTFGDPPDETNPAR